MIERFLAQTTFTSEEDFKEHLKFKTNEDFNFAYDVMDAWAEEAPDKLALLWTSERGEEKRFTFAQLKEQTDQAASYLQSLGIGRGDMVMLILKRHYEWWLAMLALSKIGAVAIPATHMLTAHDIVYRNNRASIKAIVCVNDDYVTAQVHASLAESPTVEVLVAVNSDTELGKAVPTDFHCWNEEWDKAPAFVRPEHVNTNDDTLLIYFTSGTSGEPKMVAHDHLYALGHLATGVFWHNLNADSIHLTVADTGWGKAVWGKLYGQWFAGATVFVYDHEKFTAEKIMRQIEKYRIVLRAAHHLPLHDTGRLHALRPLLAQVLYHRGRGARTCSVPEVLRAHRHTHDGGFRADRDHHDPRHLPLEHAQARQHGQAQPAIRHPSAQGRRLGV